eukprot:9847509-Alexandrium_andersonii.AAC.1
MSASLVGSEMCIRDSWCTDRAPRGRTGGFSLPGPGGARPARSTARAAVSYTHLTLPTICSV